MAKEYLEKLSNLVNNLGIESDVDCSTIDVKHLFSGAAFYIDGKVCASWSPSGLAFKLQESEVDKLISCGEGKPLKYFPKGHIKKGYVVFDVSDLSDQERWKSFFLKAITHASSINN